VSVRKEGEGVVVSVRAGPGEPVVGKVVVKEEGTGVIVVEGMIRAADKGSVELVVPANAGKRLVVVFEGSERLKPGQIGISL